MKEKEEVPKINKIILNNFLTSLRPIIKKAIYNTGKKLSLKSENLKKKNLKEASRRRVSLEEAFLKGKKLEKFEEQLTALKSFNCLDIVKFVVLVKKPLLHVLRDRLASVEQKALTRVAYEIPVEKKIQDFRSKYPNWAKETPSIIKNLGKNYMKLRLKKLKISGNNDKASEDFKSSEESRKKLLILLNEIEPAADSLLPVKRKSRKKNSSVQKKTKKLKINKVKGQVKKRSATEESKKKIEKKQVEVKDDDEVEKVLQVNKHKKLKNKLKFIKQNEKPKILVSKKPNSKFNNNELKIKENKNLQEATIIKNNKKMLAILSKKANNSSKEPSTLSSKNETIKKQNGGTSKVTILDLNKIGKEKKRSKEVESKFLNVEKRKGHSSKSEDEKFLKNGSVTKKKKSSSSFPIGRMETTSSDGGNNSDVSNMEDHSQKRSELKPMLIDRLKRKVLNEEDNEYDSSKLKKSKYENRDKKFGGRSGSRGGFSGGGKVRGGGERSFRGGRGRGSFRDTNRNSGGRTEGDIFGNKGKFDSRGRGMGRGKFGNNDRRRSFSKDSEARSFGGRGRGSGSRRGFAGRGRNRQNYSDFSGSSNFASLGKRKSL